MNGVTYTATKIAEITGGELISTSTQDGPVQELLTDSRLLTDPSSTLFIALVSSRNDGHRYIGELIEKGVKSFIVSSPPHHLTTSPPHQIVVPDTLTALQSLGSYHRHLFSIPIIGITGSNGKTIIKEWLYQLMSPDRKIARNPKSYNSQVGVPLSVWNLNSTHELGIFEAGISEPGEMEKLAKIIDPGIGIFTNIGHAHDEGFRSRIEKIHEKLKLFRNAKTLIYCRDHKQIHDAIQKDPELSQKNNFTWGQSKKASFIIESIGKGNAKTTITGIFGKEKQTSTIPFTDDASIENAIHCWALMLVMGYDAELIASRIQGLSPVAMRLEMKEGINRCLLINDFYNSDITSLGIALDFLNQQKQHEKKTLILSDILESGLVQDALYSEISGIIEKKGIHRLIGIGRDISRQAARFGMEKNFFENTDEFLRSFPLHSFRDEAILLKGARIFEFERISNALQQRVHETVLEINLDAIVHNLNYYRSKLRPGTKSMVMVKAFSYGSGSHEIASLLQYHHVDWLAVAYADEGIELRKSGITLPIMIMNPEEESFDQVLSFNLEPEIYNLRVLGMLEEAIRRNKRDNDEPVRIHIKVETGMHRLGFMRDDLPELMDRLQKNKSIQVASVFSHLAASEDPAEDDFTLNQVKELKEVAEILSNGTGYPFLCHILNSAGISRFPDMQMDMVRLGIGLYGVGYNEEEQQHLKNVSTLKTVISQIKPVKAGETIGYNRRGRATANMLIAIIPIGYADGLDRRLGNGKGKVFINGKPASIVGNICMDLCMADITDLSRESQVKEGDEVIIFGDSFPLGSLAAEMETIPYEVLTGISRRVKRVYYHE